MNKLYVAGIGPGDPANMTEACRAAIEEAEVVVGYTEYIRLVQAVFPEKRMLDTAMTRETERCRAALSLAADGTCTAVVCSGDAGVYGMAGLIYELSEAYPPVEIEIVPGVTAALAGAALLGAPLTHDFAVISLSDLLTPWKLIEKRLLCAAMGDFCIAMYNPSSRKRADYLQKACDLLLAHKSPETLCGIARCVGREGEQTHLLTLSELRKAQVDMFTTVFIGNAQTRAIRGKMVTPRGYSLD
ncbi:MAG: precorrin-3B C(17)-methyltransferase [Clostridiaceae bacterium]|nr:precorrin-3B C(17)-methyltransferase [Clostridiaceae bacterium]